VRKIRTAKNCGQTRLTPISTYPVWPQIDLKPGTRMMLAIKEKVLGPDHPDVTTTLKHRW
jgi:hypothetical protein